MSKLFGVAALIPGGSLLLAAAAVVWLLRCRHPGEMWRRNADDALGLECRRCGRWRLSPALANNLPGPRQTAPLPAEFQVRAALVSIGAGTRRAAIVARVREHYLGGAR